MSFNHLASNCIKSLLIICLKAAKGRDTNTSILLDKAFQSYSFIIHWLFDLFT